MDQALKDIIARWVEGKLDKTEQARAVSPCSVTEGDEKDEYTEADIWADLWEESTEQLEENRLYIVADPAKTLLQGLQLEPSQLLRFQRELLKARAGLYREETKRARGDYSTCLDELRQIRGANRQPSSPLTDPPRLSVPIGEAFADYMREHNYREGQKQIETTLRHYFDHAGLSLTSPLSSITKATLASYKKALLSRSLKVSIVNKELIHIGHFLKWAKAHDLVASVATDGLPISGKAQAEESPPKRPFSLQELTTLRSVSPTGRLFPKIHYSGAVSMFFRRIMHRAQISRPELTLHSVRHTFTTELARLNVPDKVAHYITGHAMGHDVHSRVYLHLTPDLPTLKEALQKVRF